MTQYKCFFLGHHYKFIGHTEGEWNGDTTRITLHQQCQHCRHIKTSEYSLSQCEQMGYEPWFWKELTKYKESNTNEC